MMPRKTTTKAQHETETFILGDCDCALKIVGSYEYANFSDGDIALVKLTKEVKSGDYVVIKTPEPKEAIIRQVFDIEGDRVYAPLSNVGLAPIFASDKSFEVIGRIVGIQFAS